jgi:hypothetical protein
VFVLDNSPVIYDMCSLSTFRSAWGFGPPVIIHTNHEAVHTDPDIEVGVFANYSICYNSDVLEIYMSYKYVFRTYYYAPLMSIPHVHFLPLQPAASRHTASWQKGPTHRPQ